MLSDEALIEEVRKEIEARLGWGSSVDWTNHDFIALSEKIGEQTGASLSHVTLKRVWGKLNYTSQPNAYTLNTLAQFAGYSNWREFASKSKNAELISPASEGTESIRPVRKLKALKAICLLLILIGVSGGIFLLVSGREKKEVQVSYAFSSKKVITEGLPNTVVFDYDASKAPEDSVEIQQSWDNRYRTTVSKNQRQHTSIYYLPDYYKAKLIVNNKIVKQHDLLIKSGGWLSAVLLSPVPAYIKREEVIRGGKMSLSIDLVKAHNIAVLPKAPEIIFANVQDFGPVYSDDFVFETELKNDYTGGSSVCQKTNVYLLCEGTAIGIPLCKRGCVSDVDLLFTNFLQSGKRKDLSAFGVDFSKFVKLKVKAANGKAEIFVNEQLVYVVDSGIKRSKIIGIDFVFEGAGSVNYVSLCNDKLAFRDDFN